MRPSSLCVRGFVALACSVFVSCTEVSETADQAEGGIGAAGESQITATREALGVPGVCLGGAGLQAGSPWPMRSACPKHRGESPYIGAQIATVAWSKNLGGDVRTAPAIAADGTIYAGNDNLLLPKLYAINPDGTTKWTASSLFACESSPAIAADGTVYIGNNTGQLQAFNPANGTVKWTYQGLLSINASNRVIPVLMVRC
jgi:hypothetical protein